MTQKVFPIKTETSCLLKWNFSTVFLTTLTTASCHRVQQNHIDLESFDFHNTVQKLHDRGLMLEGKWPGRGCEHCKNIEDAGGVSDRMIHLDFPGFNPPKELEIEPTAVRVTPRILEIYFSNVCNLKCVYCTPRFSSQINQENKKFGAFLSEGVHIPGYQPIREEFDEAADKMFSWLDANVQDLDALHILGGEPFIQKETSRLLDFLGNKQLPNLNLTFFSNLTIEHNKFIEQVEHLKTLKPNLKQITIIGSIDCWGKPAEYLRNGLDLALFQQNFEYLLHNTDFCLNINSTLSPLSIPTMPDLVSQINHWSAHRTVYWSMMKAGGKEYFHPTIFGPVLATLGFDQSVALFDTNNDLEKINYKSYFDGIGKEIANCTPNLRQQKNLKIYLTELDRRRGTNYQEVFPELAKLLADPEGLEPPTADFEDRNSIQLS